MDGMTRDLTENIREKWREIGNSRK